MFAAKTTFETVSYKKTLHSHVGHRFAEWDMPLMIDMNYFEKWYDEILYQIHLMQYIHKATIVDNKTILQMPQIRLSTEPPSTKPLPSRMATMYQRQ